MQHRIKYSTLFLLVYTLFSFQCFATDWQIRKGETLTYSVAFHSGLTGDVKGGKATLSVLPQTTTKRGNTVYHAVLQGESTGIVNWFYDINNRYESYMDVTTLNPVLFVQDIKENKYTRKDSVYFDHKKEIAKVDGKDISMVAGAQDFVSMLFAVRKIDYSSLSKGGKFILPLFSDRKIVNSQIIFIGKKSIKTNYGTYVCYGLKPQVAKGKIFKNSYPATIWITADYNHYPMLVEAEMKVGRIKLLLDKSN